MNVLITGASRGIGKELAIYFAKSGAKNLFLVSRDEKKLIQTKNACLKENAKTNVVILTFSLADDASFSNIKSVVKKHCAHLDILINNAGHLVNKKFPDITTKDLEDCYNINVFGPYFLTQALMYLMGGKKGSHVVNIGSMGGFQGTSKFAGLSAYTSSKMALVGLTECLAEELKPNNISVNCLAIGAVSTEMQKEAFPGYKAPHSPKEMASFIGDFSIKGRKFFNGKIIPVAVSTP